MATEPQVKMWVKTPVCTESPTGKHIPDYDHPVDIVDTMGEKHVAAVFCAECGKLLMSDWV